MERFNLAEYVNSVGQTVLGIKFSWRGKRRVELTWAVWICWKMDQGISLCSGFNLQDHYQQSGSSPKSQLEVETSFRLKRYAFDVSGMIQPDVFTC